MKIALKWNGGDIVVRREVGLCAVMSSVVSYRWKLPKLLIVVDKLLAEIWWAENTSSLYVDKPLNPAALSGRCMGDIRIPWKVRSGDWLSAVLAEIEDATISEYQNTPFRASRANAASKKYWRAVWRHMKLWYQAPAASVYYLWAMTLVSKAKKWCWAVACRCWICLKMKRAAAKMVVSSKARGNFFEAMAAFCRMPENGAAVRRLLRRQKRGQSRSLYIKKADKTNVNAQWAMRVSETSQYLATSPTVKTLNEAYPLALRIKPKMACMKSVK